MGYGFFLVIGDKATCGGKIISGCIEHTIHGQPTACEGDQYICGVDKKRYQIVGGQPGYFIHDRRAAGTAHSVGMCPCKCRFIHSHSGMTYDYESMAINTSKPVTNRIEPVTLHNVPKPLTMAPGSSCPVEEDEPSREPVDAGFCVLPYGSTPSSYEQYIFVNPP